MNPRSTSKKAFVGILIFINVFFLFIAGSSIGTGKTLSQMKSYTKNWDVVDVKITDISFSKNGSTTDDHKKTYNYIMKRKLTYTYKGKEYTIDDTRKYTSSSSNYNVSLRTNYTDEYTYSVNPSSPTSMSKSYSDLSDDAQHILAIIKKIFIVIMISIPIIIDLVVLVKYIKSKRKVFD